MKKIFLFHLLLVCPVIFLIWYIVFPNYLWLLEGNSFFSFTPDFAGIQLSLPSDWAQYVGLSPTILPVPYKWSFGANVVCAYCVAFSRLYHRPFDAQ